MKISFTQTYDKTSFSMAENINTHYESHQERFKQYRKHLGLSQTEFGDKLGLTQVTVSAIEKGKQDITIRTIYDLVELDCNPNWLVLNIAPMRLSQVGVGPTVEVIEYKELTEYRLRVKK
ncbi:helix-turn-helix domain-containing protein [Spirosoma litoris]